MTWKKHFKISTGGLKRYPHADLGNPLEGSSYTNYSSLLPEVYVGHRNRIQRYTQYENMDVDSEINAALDILAEFCTQRNAENGTAFDIFWHEDKSNSPTEVETVVSQLKEWNELNEFDKRIFKMFRNILKYGDQIFIRDPETFKWFWTDMSTIIKVIVNESEGKKVEQYVIRDLNVNFENLSATELQHKDGSYLGGIRNQGYQQPVGTSSSGTASGRFELGQNEHAVGAEHVVHLSLTEGLDPNWPFGNSILESVFKTYKQKELLEDSIIIYRRQRAPERRVFYVDIGNQPSHKAMGFINQLKNEIHQRRIPSQTGGGDAILDTTYNTLSMHEDFFFPQTAEGRGSRVDVLPGGSNLGEIDDLRFFTNKLFRGLRIPSSYLPVGFEEDTGVTHADGRLGTALIQEFRFNQYCIRLQRLNAGPFDTDFKAYLAWKGLNIDETAFELRFNEPQNFSKYREIELDSGRISAFTNVEGFPYFSKRFSMQRFLGLSEEEMNLNERLWEEENANHSDDLNSEMASPRSVGITPSGIGRDLETFGPPPDFVGPGPDDPGAGLNLDVPDADSVPPPIPDEGPII